MFLSVHTGMHPVRHHVGEGEESPAHGPEQLLRGGERLHHTSGGGKSLQPAAGGVSPVSPYQTTVELVKCCPRVSAAPILTTSKTSS